MNHVGTNPIRVCAPFWVVRGSMFVVTLLSLPVCRNSRRSGIVFRLMKRGNRQTTSPVLASSVSEENLRKNPLEFLATDAFACRRRCFLSTGGFRHVDVAQHCCHLRCNWQVGNRVDNTGSSTSEIFRAWDLVGARANQHLPSTFGNQVSDELTIGGVNTTHYLRGFVCLNLQSTCYWQENSDGSCGDHALRHH